MATTVTVAQIERRLSELWENEQIARACLFNLITYCETESDRQHVTEVIAQLTSRHPCRAIVLLARRQEKRDSLTAAISAHCHLAGGGNKQVCCEQISIEASGDSIAKLGTVVLPLLESDLPTVLWWRGDSLENAATLASVADRLIFQNTSWPPDVVLRLVEAHPGCAFTDLAWTRLDIWRKLIAESFDGQAAQTLESAEISFGRLPGARLRALLLAGWIAAQLKWSPAEATGRIRLAMKNEDAGMIGIVLKSKSATFTVQKDFGERAAVAWVEMTNCCGLPRKQAFGASDDATLLALEFDRPARHTTYERALRLAANL
jgi:glucose-6-phosphate dehydrogenase assembly protein OpcA